MNKVFEITTFENTKCKIVKFYDEYYLFVKLNKYENKCFDSFNDAINHIKNYNLY